ncbi:HAD family hydrolase [Helcococcus kunzii]|uniref:HAD family hydrolase n=1 Tax=Helcococcus kunzii TaxID=40091 RepID=UPI0021A6AA4B|nr:HAD family hydrolase [Helcococcus kunzii]MCT1796881.1 HAD family hydrolase [Helcococcus kunzii]MCT1989687.1 HAD family hydrolase [Helcococcus kunzii]
MKLIGIDLDGTLLNSDSKINKENIEALKSIANEDGYYVYICSGRPQDNIKELLDKYDLDLPRVGSNGGVAYEGDKMLFEFPFSREAALKVYKVIKDYPYLTYNRMGRFGETDHLEKLEHLFNIAKDVLTQSELKSFDNYKNGLKFHEFTDFYKMLDDKNLQILKFFMYMPIDEIKKTIQSKLVGKKGINCTESESINIEIVPDHVNKGKVFEHLEKYLNLENSTRIAIGDSLNDLEMFEMADYSFAMENAHPDIKELADYQVASNDNHGVAEAIEIIKKI